MTGRRLIVTMMCCGALGLLAQPASAAPARVATGTVATTPTLLGDDICQITQACAPPGD